ncbi:MAG: type II toxin-antitoxin system RelE/ParE family toxin [Pseudomonadota bacterium]
MPAILITPAAENDLINLWVYIARANPAAADRIYQAVEKTFETIASMPGIGAVYQTQRAKLRDLRFFPIKHFPHYLIYYRLITNGIEIIRVLHAHMEKHKRLEIDPHQSF